ncbi:MAG TPA: class I SAM-dependent methyltransferase [Anaerolineae bacterium]|nr:class I SAM-dependent methyltransferase [Anaerolineae bacterium]
MEYSETALQKVREDRLLIDGVDQWLYEEIAPYLGRRILEIGCGLGNFARHLTDRELYLGTETSVESIEHVSRVFSGYPTMLFTVADATAPGFVNFGRLDIDTVFSLNVFEHIEDHETALRNAAQVLRPGGHLILVVPAHMAFYGAIDRAIGHYRRYDKRMMAGLFHQAGLELTTQKYINALGGLGWWANSRLRSQETPPSGQLRLFNVLVPGIRAFERVVPMPFGISLLTVGRRS